MTVFYFFSGIAINDGSHSLVVNEVDPKTQFYQIYRVEARIRILARRYPQTHHICLFASCRILPSSQRLKGKDADALMDTMQGSLHSEIKKEIKQQSQSPPDLNSVDKQAPQEESKSGLNTGWNPPYTSLLSQGKASLNNYIFVYGIQQRGKEFKALQVVRDFKEAILRSVDPRSGIISLPSALYNLKGYDSHLETIASSLQAEVRLRLADNVVWRKIAVILCYTDVPESSVKSR